MGLARASNVEDEDRPTWELDVERCYQRCLVGNPQRDGRFVANLRTRYPKMFQENVHRISSLAGRFIFKRFEYSFIRWRRTVTLSSQWPEALRWLVRQTIFRN